MQDCYIVDVDGTVADASHRMHFIKPVYDNQGMLTKKDWPAFFDAAKDDAPIEHMRPLVQTLTFLSTVVFMSGRPERLRDVTQDWLKKHKFNLTMFPARLYMRADGDYRDDSIVKLELLEKLKNDGYRPVMAFDDRNRVVKMWRENGVPCLQVADGDF